MHYPFTLIARRHPRCPFVLRVLALAVRRVATC